VRRRTRKKVILKVKVDMVSVEPVGKAVKRGEVLVGDISTVLNWV
jgi:hypothetical protein